jgi:hypothetical protein
MGLDAAIATQNNPFYIRTMLHRDRGSIIGKAMAAVVIGILLVGCTAYGPWRIREVTDESMPTHRGMPASLCSRSQTPYVWIVVPMPVVAEVPSDLGFKTSRGKIIRLETVVKKIERREKGTQMPVQAQGQSVVFIQVSSLEPLEYAYRSMPRPKRKTTLFEMLAPFSRSEDLQSYVSFQNGESLRRTSSVDEFSESAEQQQFLATMVVLGINRIGVTDGRIRTRLPC